MNYADLYTEAFFLDADGIGEWQRQQLKFGDACAAIGYALGLPSFDAVREALGFEKEGRNLTEASCAMKVQEQLGRLLARQTRTPRGVLEIGCGRGEVTCAFSHLGYPVQAIDPSPGAASWMAKTAWHLFGTPTAARLICAPAQEAVVEWTAVDTVVMVESLEHILAADFAPVYERIVESLRAAHGRFIVTNWIDYHPIEVGWYAAPSVHCRTVDDALFDAWARDARTVVFRQGSHLVLDY